MAFPLHPETPEEGRSLEDLFEDRDIDIPAVLSHLKEVADSLGLAFGNRTMTYNSRKATELGKWAEHEGRGDHWHKAVFEAYFDRGLNIAQTPVLIDLAEAVGLDGREVEQVLADGRYKQAVDDDWAYSKKLGVTAVPTFIMENQGVVGAQPYEALEKLVMSVKKN